MALKALIDPQQVPLGWFDPHAHPGGWFDPELYIEAVSAGDIKTYVGLARDDTKTVISVVQASVKTWVGVDNQ
jgi:hypothetical protein